MNLKAGLYQQQTLKLTMTQELTQAIALLQYSTQELTSFLENKALENPLLEIETGHITAMDPRKDQLKLNRMKPEKDKQSWIEQIGAEVHTLSEYLLSQLTDQQITSSENKIYDYLIHNLDENGYLLIGTKELMEHCGLTSELASEYIDRLQQLEPVGIGARSLQECLLLQVKDYGYDLAEVILEEHFEAFADRKWKPLAKLLGVDLKEIQEVFDYVQTLDPRPASRFQTEKASYVVPDVVIKWDGESFAVSIFDELIPKIKFNTTYYQKFSKHEDQQVNRFLNEKQQDYHWILKSLEQRKETLTNVSMKIVEKQSNFFIKGPSHLKPMTMKEIADELEIHESTVSRAVREKYAQTPYGTFELRSFFSSTIQTTSDENTSSQQVKNVIQRLVDKENKQKPLSDQQLVSILKDEEGIVVSRRTIAKYRDQLGIPSSSKRKRYE
ncbi:RNA polymerase factor sigma-54 [Cytobacillus spongiae]|uniref:RNA polymerase factor sigma-54 n=1 Tax=Cytobacillus spongiae TaxID=2901381 RepID=UPI001F32A2CB|nr:RNA polymerase factor sigma-54 [Cytobacillus spongiae]UII55553.1 RNA polymerase factor sigma-54 [Cytobacillus spongiae]